MGDYVRGLGPEAWPTARPGGLVLSTLCLRSAAAAVIAAVAMWVARTVRLPGGTAPDGATRAA